ncbi:hypothetical protein BOX37_31295 [Nocardia mangyaensis]|uniref:Uncharacterized protein n=1 Tax=Nocardia mangyaensis TaxID=2213200 RepID=A0A1J0W006_9NOCA|nr:hypothetical protein [Nocardia mangyaensis]APE37680.1 hypothetical protein BOX37_31295 [Nocardia mangyaensis]
MDGVPAGSVRLLLRGRRPGTAGGIRGLVEFWDRFGAALDYDLLERGIDVRECFGPKEYRTRDWRTIWRFKDRLPRGSRYRSALLTDRELAELVLEHQLVESPDDQPEALSPDEYTLDTYLLLSIIDAVHGVQASVIAAAGGGDAALRPVPRPDTALEVIRAERRSRAMRQLIDQFTAKSPMDRRAAG